MIGLDCNILVQHAFQNHPANPIFPPLIVTEFLHVTTDPRRFSPALTMHEALGWIERFLANSSIRVLQPNPASIGQTFLWLRQFNLGRKRILDTHLAAVLHSVGVKRLMTSNPADFAVFGVFEIITP